MPYEIPFQIGDEVVLRERKATYNGGDARALDIDKVFGAVGTVDSIYSRLNGSIRVFWPPEITGQLRSYVLDAWCLEAANKPPTNDEIAEAFGLIGMPATEEKPSDGHLHALYRITQEGDWARERLERYLGKNWHTHFEEE